MDSFFALFAALNEPVLPERCVKKSAFVVHPPNLSGFRFFFRFLALCNTSACLERLFGFAFLFEAFAQVGELVECSFLAFHWLKNCPAAWLTAGVES